MKNRIAVKTDVGYYLDCDVTLEKVANKMRITSDLAEYVFDLEQKTSRLQYILAKLKRTIRKLKKEKNEEEN